MVFAGLAAGGSSSDHQKSRAKSCLTAMPLDGQYRRITLAEDPGSTRPELRIFNEAQRAQVPKKAGGSRHLGSS
jgi:hypothetical protein